jgi:hypothetical protein
MKNAVLIHGLHVDSPKWEHLVLGDPGNGMFGRAGCGILEALHRGSSLIIWGTGASQRNGLKESEYTLDRVREHIVEIASRCELSPMALLAYVDECSYCDTATQNTAQEVRAALRLCHERGIQELTLVSSPGHLPRCYRDARKAARELGVRIKISATGADTGYDDPAMDDPVIVEGAHRPDRAAPSFHTIVGRLFKFYGNPQLADGLANDIAKVVDGYEEQLKKAA